MKYCLVMILWFGTTYSGLASAGDSAFRAELKRRSATEALEERMVSRLNVVATNLRPQLAGAIALALEAQGLTPQEASGARKESSWSIQIEANGSRGSLKRIKRPQSAPARWSISKRPSTEDLEPVARRVVMQTLAEVLVLGADEELVPWKVVHNIRSSGGPEEHEIHEELVSSTLQFARVIGGIPVLGGQDSKVEVTFGSDDTILSISYDWPRLRPEPKGTRTVPRSVMTRRVGALKKSRGAESFAESLECGYVVHDKGDQGRLLTPACVATYKVERSGIAAVYVDVVPLEDQPTASPSWPETIILNQGPK